LPLAAPLKLRPKAAIQIYYYLLLLLFQTLLPQATQLKRAGLSSNQLLHYYVSVIRPVLEYSAPVWHYALTKEQTHQIEKIQKHAIHIIFNFSRGMPYTSMLYTANLNTLNSLYPYRFCYRLLYSLYSNIQLFSCMCHY